jgi:predicted PurR-regulated permease PerM
LPEEQERRFVETFRRVSRATVIGNLMTSLCQGAVSGLIFLILGLPNPILWGALTALMSLVPVVGTALVWVPWTIYLLATGSLTRAIIFAILQVVLVGGIDNILRPLLMESHMRLHTLLVFFSIVGGISYFGLAGLFLGPLVFAIALAFIDLYKERNLIRRAPNRMPSPAPQASSDFDFDSED